VICWDKKSLNLFSKFFEKINPDKRLTLHIVF